jgi:hypothetical protein
LSQIQLNWTTFQERGPKTNIWFTNPFTGGKVFLTKQKLGKLLNGYKGTRFKVIYDYPNISKKYYAYFMAGYRPKSLYFFDLDKIVKMRKLGYSYLSKGFDEIERIKSPLRESILDF